MKGRLIPAIVVCLAWVAPASAQRLAYLHGRVLDPSEAAVAAASITVVSEDTGFRRFAESQPDGEYMVGSLQPGVYKITVRKEGFRAMVRFNVRLEVAQPTRADFLLSMGAIEETITVEGTAPLLSPDEASTETRVFHEEIERLPLNGRGLLALLELTPGANVTPATRGEAGQFTANGQRPNANYFTVDGMSANTGVSAGGLPAQASGGALPAMSAFGSLDSLMPLEAVEEFRVQASNAAPDVSRLPGAVVALTSRSGSNEFHGSTVFRFRHELLAANDWFANNAGQGRAPLRMEDVSPSFGGPIRRDHTWCCAGRMCGSNRCRPYPRGRPPRIGPSRRSACFPLPTAPTWAMDWRNGTAATSGHPACIRDCCVWTRPSLPAARFSRGITIRPPPTNSAARR
jgi:hypothetical protein